MLMVNYSLKGLCINGEQDGYWEYYDSDGSFQKKFFKRFK